MTRFTLRQAVGCIISAIAFQLFIGALVFMFGCSHGGDVPNGLPWCLSDTHVHPCDGYPLRDGLACATCDDDNSTLTCEVDTGADYLDAVCVADCSACSDLSHFKADTASTPLSSAPGVHLCAGPMELGGAGWCATCDLDDLTMTAEACDTDGFCNPVVCVRTCDACSPWPGPGAISLH